MGSDDKTFPDALFSLVFESWPPSRGPFLINPFEVKLALYLCYSEKTFYFIIILCSYMFTECYQFVVNYVLFFSLSDKVIRAGLHL